MKKILLLFFIATCSFGYSQYAVADFIALNDGTDDDYHKLEKFGKYIIKIQLIKVKKQDGLFGKKHLSIMNMVRKRRIMLL